MAEQHTDQTSNEVETLRRTNGELIAKNSTRKQRIAELEVTNADLQSQLAAANGRIHELTIGAPLKSMAENISTCPNEWMEAFGKSYRLEMVNGELTIVALADAKPVMKEGKAVPFEREALKALLLDEKHPQTKLFNAITIVSKATGAATIATQKREPVPAKPTTAFGLR